ncbi:MAG: putative polysaccharide deacetylase [Bacteroidota bacterium]|jgi:peptidoglycan/xylan/chitin deacetylase (PgdA/CDA1 family)|nr:putative polysaccharide deacetylase [Bacteroidota bacterium]
MEKESQRFTDTYKEVKLLNPPSLRSFMRDKALDLLSYRDRFRGLETELKKPRIQFIYLHHMFRDELTNFEKLMDQLSKHHEFISFSEAVEKIVTGTIDKPYISISSDDGFKNNLLALDILKDYNAKACFFVNTDIVNESDFNTLKKYCAEKLNFPPVEFLTWKEVEKIQADGHEIGSHTRSHERISELSNQEITDNIEKTSIVLKKYCGEAKHFAFPYGRFTDFNHSGREAVFRAGFISCSSAERGCHINGPKISHNELCIRRDHMILDWNIDHILYFIAKNSRNSSPDNNLFPLTL